MNEYEGKWLTTYTGVKFHFLSPSPDEINIKDIAHALALTCRYGGHCNKYYSVGEHSVRVAQLVDERSKLAALLHDAAEAYVPDIPRPIKMVTNDLNKIYKKIQEEVLKKFGAENADWKSIKQADNVMLATEAPALGFDISNWAETAKPIPISCPLGWTPIVAERIFMASFREYTSNQRMKKKEN